MTNDEKSAAEMPEADAAGEAGQGTEDAPKHEELTLMLEDARAKADDHWDQLLRARAELENARRRAQQDVENAHKYALDRFTLELLPVRDSLEMGLAAISGDDEKVKQLHEGTELTLKMLTAAMEKFGIKAIDPLGEPFNPELHQAMSMQESTDYPPDTVMAVLQKGYQLNDRLIRPAMVVVSKATRGADQESHVDEQA